MELVGTKPEDDVALVHKKCSTKDAKKEVERV